MTRLTRELREVRERQTATAGILQIIASSPSDVQPVFDAVAEHAMSLLDCWSVIVIRFDGEHVHFGAARGALPDTEQFARQRYQSMRPDRASLLGRSIFERTVVSSADAQGEPDPQLRDYARKRGLRAVLIVPLLRDDRVEGALVLTRAEPGLFAAREIELIQTFADQAVIAIANMRLFEEVRARTRDLSESLQQQTATADVLKVISRSAFDLQTVLKKLVESALELCNAPQGLFLLRDGDSYRFAIQVGLSQEFEEYLSNNPFPMDRTSGAGRAALTGQVSHVHDVLSDPDYRFSEGSRLGGYRSLLSVPLLREQQVIGVFSLGRTEPEPFTERQIELVRTFADQAVIAIENARLFNETKEALERQTATAEILKVIAGSPADVQPVFNAIAERARLLCGARVGSTTRFDGELLHLVGYHGASPEGEAAMRAAFPMKPGRGSVNARTILAKAPVQIVDVQLDPEYRVTDAAQRSGFRSGLGVPLLFEGRAIGSIFVGRAEPGAFPERLIALLQTFADQAVIAIENVRLFNELQARTTELAASLDDLRAAQDRLVQTEKLASLGQLTAGIAHEIKNPLNFVNNFSALSAELIDEMKDVLSDINLDKNRREELDEITQTLKTNLEKVVQHGKRADSIVKNMLLHSRQGSGEHCPVDINAIVDESLSLAYHGARAENADFDITVHRSFDPSIGMADGYPQEITRVLLNLISNGFYAATKRKAGAGDGFEPTLTVTTKNLGDRIEIRIRDNGTGIPTEVKEKIFNPFFTTKPAGEGTGLGLSMSHDIIVKQHGGTIDVDTAPDVFTEFKIVLPRAGASLIKPGEHS